MYKELFFRDKIVRYDEDMIASMKSKIDKTAEELRDLNNDILEAVEEMERDWNTTEGKKFLEDVSTDWSPQVEKYIDVLETISLMLTKAETEYTALTEKAQLVNY